MSEINEYAQQQIDNIKELCERIKPLVVIHCITYNHEPYITDALDGFIMQKTDFPFVAIVHEDASTDHTANILRKYAELYPDIILPIFETENQYSKKDGSLDIIMNKACNVAGAKYIAICEGDDYWTDPLKLQKQVDFLETHTDYGMCYTKVKRVDQGNKLLPIIWGGPNIYFEELLYEFNAPTLTTIFRSDILKEYYSSIQPETKDWVIGDFPRVLFFSLESRIHFIDEVTGIYRILQESASHSKSIGKLIPYLQSIYDVKNFFIKKYNKKSERYNIETTHLIKLLYYLPIANDEYKIICLNQVEKCKDSLGMFKYLIIKYRIKYRIVNLIYRIYNRFKIVLK